MPGTALWLDGFICLPGFVSLCLPTSCVPLSPKARLSGRTGSFVSAGGCLARQVHLSPFLSLHLSLVVSLEAWHGFVSGRIHLSPFVSLYSAPVGCSLDSWHGSLGGRIHLFPTVLSAWTGSIVSPSCCLPAWMDGFICLPLSPFICPRLSRIHVLSERAHALDRATVHA